MGAHDRPVFRRRCDNQVMNVLLLDELPSSLLIEKIEKPPEPIVGRRILPSDCGGQMNSLLDEAVTNALVDSRP
ncbi:Hypothetical protein NGAL_HAMBI2605_30690 [Neorhizobium galegae bv. orientalis]|nr:Hypothetical protein NGAL_HAMBI2566_39220 [Neorhizobium galegae bv. orientalis]CDZ64599.1 Hypothetical protein NGAL_HAMBI2605_30690 [Neorhizobium galegae bv. orientalis]CDZ71934.1 Hypothetical protein NGAL_HAMBI2610_35500 [Neorhizobium galegae bv. orientalis]